MKTYSIWRARCFILALFFILVTESTSTLAANKLNASFCKSIAKNKTHQAFLFDDEGTQIDVIDIGTVRLDELKFESDFAVPGKLFRVVLTSKKMHMDSICTLSSCIYQHEKKSLCPSTKEYVFSVGINPSKIGPGKFENEIFLGIDEFGVSAKKNGATDFKFQQLIVGDLAMPWLAIENTKSNSYLVKNIFDGLGETFTAHIINTGNSELRLGSWEAQDTNQGDFKLRSSCENIELKSKDTCDFVVTSKKQLTSNTRSFSWFNFAKNSPISIELEITKYDSERYGIEIKNKLY